MTKTISNSIFKWVSLFIIISFFAISCNKDDVMETTSPTITFNEESGIYTVKIGQEITITPTVTDATKPTYSWKMDGKVVGSGPAYTFSAEKIGQYFVSFKVDADNGYAEDEIRIDVVEKMVPVISLAIPQEGYFTAISGKELEIAAEVKFSKGASYNWKLNGRDAGSDSIYVFKQDELKDYSISLTVTNEDGKDEVSTTVKVLEALPLSIEFDAVEDENGRKRMTVPLGRTLYITPIIVNDTESTVFTWQLDGSLVSGATGKTFEFKPEEIKDYNIQIIGTTGPGNIMVVKSVIVQCVAEEGEFYREATSSSRAVQTKVFEYLPAPGQFINEGYTANTIDEANSFAEKEMNKDSYVSLGGFGGYIVVGFDHSILNIAEGDGYDFAVYGNSFSGSSEPGIVWVMQDENGNGLPDDTWYELKGSEYGKSETIQNYAVTYYKPAAPGMNVQWRDNRGKSGYIDYMKEFHTQDYYYPAWVKTSSYTLRGTCLKARNVYNPNTNNWENKEYDWGYADNYGTDRGRDSNNEAETNANYFKIENAVYPNGTPVNLKYIDFIKVQSGVNAKSGWIGEVSTEVFGFEDVNLNK